MISLDTIKSKNGQEIILSIIVFFCGMSIMIIELVGSRVIAPYVGTSIYVWTSLIGVILGSLSLGNYYGGILADKNNRLQDLVAILFLAGISTTAIIYFRYLAYTFGIIGLGFRIESIILVSFLFVPSTFFFGMVTPYAIRLRLKNIETSGSAVGRLYALSTIGSIVGTFLGGFFLISYFGNTNILLVLGVITILLSFSIYLLNNKNLLFTIIVFLGIGATIFALYIPKALTFSKSLIIDTDTPYKRVWVYDKIDEETGRSARIMTDTIFGGQSGIFLSDPLELFFEYQKYFDLAFHFNPNGTKALMVGAGVFTYPPHYLKEKPENTIDVVEIDPALKEIAHKYFYFKNNKNLSIIHQDGRIFLNNTKNIYDSIFLDAFSSMISIPYQLTTKETLETIYKKLSPNGVVIANIISAIDGPRGEFLRAEYTTYRSVFPTVLLFKVHKDMDNMFGQNLILIALKEKNPILQSKDAHLNALLKNLYQKQVIEDMPILYDDFAPVEKYTAKLML